MTIETLLEQIKNARQQMEEAPEGFYTSLYASYGLTFLETIRRLVNTDAEQPEALKKALKELLAKNFAFIQGTLLCYAAIPNHPITRLCCSLATELADECTPPLAILMPGVALVPTDGEHYPDFEEKRIPLSTILSQHVLGRNHRYLIPIKLLTHIDVLTESYPNIYFDAFDQAYNSLNLKELEALLTLDSDEVARLFQHSGATEQLLEAKAAYADLVTDDSTLLGKLNALIRALKQASVNGSGQEELSGVSFSLAAQDFYTFYARLDKTVITTIPAQLREEIELLKHYFTGMRQYDVGSCFATRADELEEKVRGHEIHLASIKLEGEALTELLAKAKAQFEEAQEALRVSLAIDDEDTTYQGEDKLPLTQALLDKLEVSLTLDTDNLVQCINRLHAEDIHLLMTDVVKRQLIAALNSAEEAVMFLSFVKPHLLEKLLPLISGQLIDTIREHHGPGDPRGATLSNQQLYAALAILSPERQTIVLDNVDINNVDTHERNTLLINAAQDGNLELVRALLDKGCDINTLNGFRETALYLAVTAGHLEVVRLLLDRGADSSITCSMIDRTPLHEACSRGNSELVELLLTKGDEFSLNRQDNNGITPLMVTVLYNKHDCTRLLLEHDALLHQLSHAGESVMLHAASGNDWPLVEELIEKGADINQLDNRQQGLMYYAARDGQITLIERFSQQGLSVNQQTKFKETPLLVAAKRHRYEAVKKLLELGADIKATDDCGCNALQLARYYSTKIYDEYATVIQLVSQGALITKTNGARFASPLFSDIGNGYLSHIIMYLHDKHLNDFSQMQLLTEHFPYSEYLQHWQDRYKDFLRTEKEDLEKRQSDYHYYGLFKYLGANSRSQEITAIDHFNAWLDGDKTKLTDLDRTVLSRGHLAPLTQGFNLLTNGDFLSANPTPPPLRISIA